MNVRLATYEDLAAIEAVVRWSCSEAIGELVPESVVDAEIEARFRRPVLAEHILSRRLVVCGDAEGHLEVVALVDDQLEFTELSTVVVPAHPSKSPDGRVLVAALRSMGWTGPLVSGTALGHTVQERFHESAGFAPGEVTVARLAGHDVFRRRWWLGPALSAAG
ncbi:MAG TPA: hypothetical protein VFD97_05795 [Acidimicrobiia bacterium]|nr:hypothetical protein [Acidimicrobiia bacterium]